MYATLLMDVEDLIDPESDDIAKICAEILLEEGVQATMCIVGEKARLLRKRRRVDVIEALSKHDIGYHTDLHSVHPTIAEFLQNRDWEDGVEEAMKYEAPGVEALKSIFGVTPSCWGGPGNTWGPQICAAMRRCGVPAFVYGFTSVPEGQVHRFEDILAYPEGSYFSDSVFHLDSSVDRHLQKILMEIEKDRTEGIFWRQIFIGHPTRIQHTSFWDDCFADGVNPPEAERKSVEKKTERELERTLRNFRRIVVALRDLPGLKLRTIRQMNEILAPLPSFQLNSLEQRQVWEPIEAKLKGMTEWPILPKGFDPSSICDVMHERLPSIERLSLPV